MPIELHNSRIATHDLDVNLPPPSRIFFPTSISFDLTHTNTRQCSKGRFIFSE